MTFLLGLAVVILILCVPYGVVWELVTWHVYGWFLSEEKLDAFFKANPVEEMELNYFDNNILSNGKWPHFLANSAKTLTGKWYISKMGRIPRWSPWHEKLEQKREWLMKDEQREV